jgi:hypothetical protein
MLELALIHSETTYPEYLELWMRSLPPNERSRYVAMLYNENHFKNVPWNHHFYKYSLQDRRAEYDGTTATDVVDGGKQHVVEGGDKQQQQQQQQQQQRPHRMPTPPKPLGDNRHSPKNNSIRNAAYFFYEVLDCACLFEDRGNGEFDCNSPLNAKYTELIEPDILETIGPVFGIRKSEIVFDSPTENRVLSPSERILRCWTVLHRARRLCKTELEDALGRGPAGIRDLLERGITLIRMTLGDDPTNPLVGMTDGVQGLLFSSNRVEFMELPITQPINEECDYCGQLVPKHTICSKCKLALYCNRECQTKDWKRHKWLCKMYNCCQSTTSNTTNT